MKDLKNNGLYVLVLFFIDLENEPRKETRACIREEATDRRRAFDRRPPERDATRVRRRSER